ncbi:MAG: PIN domain-containing protein [Pirellulales bacterium]
MILDTNAVSAILVGEPLIQTRLPAGVRQHLPVIVIGEYQFGMLGSKRRKKMELAFARLESQSIILPCDRSTADQYAAIQHDLKLRGRPIPINDVWIAALARQHSLQIVSRDPHFDQVQGVRRVSW